MWLEHGHDCLVPECPVLCLMGFVWVKRADGKWYAETDYIERARVAHAEER